MSWNQSLSEYLACYNSMMHKYSLDRFKKAQTAEPFSVKSGAVVQAAPSVQARPSFKPPVPNQVFSGLPPKVPAAEPAPASSTCTGGGQSTWQPPDWAVEPKPGIYWLDVMKDGEVVDKINVEKRRNIFGRQAVMCDFVLDHPSVSRQHAAVVQHKNGSVYVIDLGSVHGTFVANERLSKDSPVELEPGQSLKFAASTRSYVLRKGLPQAPQPSQLPVNVVLPPPPDPSDEEAVVVYNTLLNKLGIYGNDPHVSHLKSQLSHNKPVERPVKKLKRSRVTFRDQYNGVLVEVVGISDGADVGTEPGPLGVKEGSLVGRFDDLVEVTVIPKGKEAIAKAPSHINSKGVTEKLQQFIEKVKSPGGKGGLYDDAPPVRAGVSWAMNGDRDGAASLRSSTGEKKSTEDKGDDKSAGQDAAASFDDDLDDLFGDAKD